MKSPEIQDQNQIARNFFNSFYNAFIGKLSTICDFEKKKKITVK